jgi:uncharacterized protein YjbJ (UPF0337 family)
LGSKTRRHVKRAQQKSDNRPVLFVDVDGVISLFGFNPSESPPGSFHSIDGIIHCIGSEAPSRLAKLAQRYELVWATGWEEKANEYLVHILEMPEELPVLTFDGRAVFGSSHWKVDAIDEYSKGRPAAWIDDNLDERAVHWAENREEPTLLVTTDSPTGITDEHVNGLLRFAHRVSQQHPTGGDDMGDGAADEAKGRLKEAAGSLTDDDSLKAEGKVDKATGSTKNAVGKAADKVKDAIRGGDRR